MKAQGFLEDSKLGVLTTTSVLDGAPILLVSHDEDDGGWQFLCGSAQESTDGRIVHLEEMVRRDPSLAQVADLPLGWIAYRESQGSEWHRAPYDENE